MERQRTVTFETPCIYINCYGKGDAVSELEAFWDLHVNQESCDFVTDVAIEMLLNRIEGFAVGKNLLGEAAAQTMNDRLDGADLLIGGGKFSLLAFFWNPSFYSKKLGLSEEENALMMDKLKSIYYPNENFDWREI